MPVSPPKPPLRTAAIVCAAIFAIVVPAAQALLHLGLSAGEFAAEGNETLRAANYTFAIWSLIYLGLIVYAIYQALPSTADSQSLQRFGWPSVVAMFGTGLWIVASALDLKLASVAIILVSAASVALPLWRGGDVRSASPRQSALIVWPVGLLAGWLTAAAVLNIITEATAFGWVTPRAAPIWGGAGIAVAAVLGLTVAHASKLLAYPLAIAWALFGIYAAEQGDRPSIAVAAGAAGALLLVYGWVVALVSRRAAPAHS
ncbi:MAG: hypothetical protein QM759_15325 [Terricaulis sp.]